MLGCTEEVTFEQRFERNEGINQVLAKNIPDREKEPVKRP